MSTYLETTGKLNAVNAFLSQQNPQFLGGQKPWLFCDSTWLEETELLFQANGQPFTDPSTNQQANMRTFTPPKTIELDVDTTTLLQNMQQGTSPNCLFSPSFKRKDTIELM